MRLTKTQKLAIENTPLYYTQSEHNLNCFCWVSDTIDKDFQLRTVNKLIELGVLVHPMNHVGTIDWSIAVKPEER